MNVSQRKYRLPTATRRLLQKLAPEVLFHGTRFLSHIVADDELAAPLDGNGAIYFSRCPDEASWHAATRRYDFDDGRGAIIALDRQRLAANYKIHPLQIRDASGQSEAGTVEYIAAPLHDLSDYVVGILRLEHVTPGLGLTPPRTPNGERYVPVEVTLRAWLANELRELVNDIEADKRTRKALCKLVGEHGGPAVRVWPFLNGPGAAT